VSIADNRSGVIRLEHADVGGEQLPTQKAYHTVVTDNLRNVQALIVVDMQTAFVSGNEAVPGAAGLLVAVTDLMRRAREAGSLVVQLQNDGLPGTADEPHTPGWELFLPAPEGDGRHVIRKDTDDGFHKTELSSLLTKCGIRHLAVCGVMSEMCVSATARSALNLGYHVVLPHDGHATYDIPAVEGLADAVPHTMASRVAEWALGDPIDIIAHAADVQFQPLPACSVEDPTTGIARLDDT
jgi:nicotinamidase-related amidase